jgi:hypothetical protein
MMLKRIVVKTNKKIINKKHALVFNQTCIKELLYTILIYKIKLFYKTILIYLRKKDELHSIYLRAARPTCWFPFNPSLIPFLGILKADYVFCSQFQIISIQYSVCNVLNTVLWGNWTTSFNSPKVYPFIKFQWMRVLHFYRNYKFETQLIDCFNV